MMYKVEDLNLITGLPIKIPGTDLEFHQPTIKEIAMLGEEKFFQSMNIFFIDSAPLEAVLEEIDEIKEEDKKSIIESTTSYDNLHFIIRASYGHENDGDIMETVNNAFNLILPGYKIKYEYELDELLLINPEKKLPQIMDRELFMTIRAIAIQAFVLEEFFVNANDNDMSDKAKAIAEKMAQAQAKINKMKGEDEEQGYFSRLLSIMGVYKDLDYLSSLTIYQLYNQFQRFGLYESYHHSVDASMAGATEVEIVDWYKKI